MQEKEFSFFRNFSKKIRLNVIKMTSTGNSSHVGSALSIVDILTVLYSRILNFDVDNPKDPNRDRFILSKGHAGVAVYAVLAHVGFFPESYLKDHYQNGSKFSGHISHVGIPGIELSTGSLGHGLGIGSGMALAGKLNKRNYKVYVLMSDGEFDEGSNWEAILFAAHRKLDNLVAIVDYNKLQSMESKEKTLNIEPFVEKWKSFGWNVSEVDGHNFSAIINSLEGFAQNGKPSALICHTVKGKGVSFMENSVLWHYRSPQGDEYEDAISEVEAIDLPIEN